MINAEFVSEVASESGQTQKVVTSVINAMCSVLADNLKSEGDEVVLLPKMIKLVTIKVPAKKARMGRNPQTGEALKLKAKPAHNTVKAKVLSALK